MAEFVSGLEGHDDKNLHDTGASCHDGEDSDGKKEGDEDEEAS